MYLTAYDGTNQVMNKTSTAYFPNTINQLAEFEKKYSSKEYDKSKKSKIASSKPKTGIEMFI